MTPDLLKKSFFVSIILTLLMACAGKHKPENSGDAIVLAEEFVRNNGYTTFEPDRRKFDFEVSDDLIQQDVTATLKKRYNTLQPKAFCILEVNYGWHVGFLKPGININDFDSFKVLRNPPARIVTVYQSGETRMSPRPPEFSDFSRLK